MSAVGEADALLWIILDRISKGRFAHQIFVAKEYSLAELQDDLREVRRLLEPETKTPAEPA